MVFNFEKAIKEAADESKSTLLGAIVLGPSGAGKSSIMGTLPGKILYLYTSGESHGPQAARALGGANVVPVCIDRDGEQRLSSDAAYERLLSILTAADDIKKLGVTSVAVDGASEIEAIIRSTEKWAKMCQTAQGKHSGFEEGKATTTMFRPIINALKTLQNAIGVHYAITCILDVKVLGSDGSIEEATPRLQGYSVAESVVQQFGDVLVVGRMEKAGVVKHKLQFMSDVTKVSKDQYGSVKKAINFAPRITGLTVEALPPIMDADLSKVVELKKEKLK